MGKHNSAFLPLRYRYFLADEIPAFFARYLSYISHLHEKSFCTLVLRLHGNGIDIAEVTSLERRRLHVKLTCADDPIFLHPL